MILRVLLYFHIFIWSVCIFVSCADYPLPSSLTLSADVTFGKSVVLNFDGILQHLNIRNPAHRCTIKLIDTEPIYSLVGGVSAKSFSCAAQNVSYTHYGYESPGEDTVKFRLSLFTPTDFLEYTLFAVIRVLDPGPSNLILKGFPLHVNKSSSESQRITVHSVKMSQDELPDYCHVSVVTGHRFPRFGHLVTGNQRSLTCGEFFSGEIYYQITAETFTSRDYIIIKMETLDSYSNGVTEYFQFPVQIDHAPVNLPPKIAFTAQLLLDVQSYTIKTITSEILLAEDAETTSDNLIYHVVQAPETTEGFLVRLDDPTHPIEAFSQKDISTLRTAFRPPLQSTKTDNVLEFFLEVVDPEGLVSDSVLLMVSIRPGSYRGPFVVFNTGLTLYEGEAGTLWRDKNLAVADEDSYTNISFRVIGGLAHGRLLQRDTGGSVKKFVAADLEIGSLMYKHDGSDSTSDSVVLQMDDGQGMEQHQVEFLVATKILPVDDQPPVLLVNTGILVHHAQEMVKISNKTLRAKDMECGNDQVYFHIAQESPMWGYFFLTEDDKDIEASRENKVDKWTQADIDGGNLFYQHEGDPSQLTSTWYSMEFSLADNNDPPNLSPHLHPLSVTFIPQDTQPPRSLSSASMQLRVNSSQVAIISNRILHFVDDFTSDRDILLIVRALPRLGALIWTGTERDSQRIPVEFSQSKFSYGEIAYQAPVLVTADATQHDQLVVDVRDKQGNVMHNQTLHILIEPPPASKLASKPRRHSSEWLLKPPAAASRVIVMKEGEMAAISHDYLLVSDPDINRSAIHYTVDKAPAMGMLWLNNKSLTLHDHFTGDSLANPDSGLVYKNMKTAHTTNEDLVRLKITADDATDNPIATELHFRIIPAAQSDQPKKLGLSKLGMVLTVPEGTRIKLDRMKLLGSAETDNYPPSNLLFELLVPPQKGSLLVNGTASMKFSWKDIEEDSVEYQAQHRGHFISNALFDDDLSFRIISMDDHWVIGDKIIDHLEIQILLIEKIISTTIGKPFRVNEGESGVLTQEHIVMPAPQSGTTKCSLTLPPAYGQLFDVMRNIPVTEFSNFDIYQHQVYYQQNNHKQVEPRSDVFRMNCAGVWLEFLVSIDASNDESPVVMSNDMQVAFGEQVPLAFFVYITDGDIPEDNLTIDIVKFPQRGMIVYNTTKDDPNEIQMEPAFHPVRNFSNKDLARPDRIIYRHDGTSTHRDDFTIRVADGEHIVEKTIHVTIQGEAPLDDGHDSRYGLVEVISSPVELVGPETEFQFYNMTDPQLNTVDVMPLSTVPPLPEKKEMPNITVNDRNGPLQLLSNKYFGVVISKELINITRTNLSSPKELLFEIIEPPKFGSFMDLREPDRSVHMFTENSLTDLDIVYALPPSADSGFATGDFFTLQAINEYGIKSKILSGAVRWTWMAFAKESYEVNEMAGVIKVGVIRRGWLDKRDFVSIKARDLSATMGKDYKDFALQAEFQPGQNETSIDIKIMKDEVYESKEMFQLFLEEPQFANIRKPFVTTISITDRDDNAVIYIPNPLYFVQENIGVYNLTLNRGGRDISYPLSIICYTTDGTATGTISRKQQIFRPDFVSRLNIHSSTIQFRPNETTATCPLVIVNDEFAEEDENFFVNIRPVGGARVGIYAQTEIIIKRDIADEPVIQFAKNEYHTNIFEPHLEVIVERKGGDLHHPSEVEVTSSDGKRLEVVYFGPGEDVQTVTLKDIAGIAQKAEKKLTRFFLNNAHFAQLGQPNYAIVHVQNHINLTVLSSVGGGPSAGEVILLGNEGGNLAAYELPDTFKDCPHCQKEIVELKLMPESSAPNKRMDFAKARTIEELIEYQKHEELVAKDIKHAEPEKNAKRSFLQKISLLEESNHAQPVARGAVKLKDGTPTSSSRRTANYLFHNVSYISFAKTHYEIVEPLTPRTVQWISIPVIRTGNLSKSDIVRVITKDGTAKAGPDYEAIDTVINFGINRSQEIIQIRIVYDETTEATENFTVNLYALKRTGAIIEDGMTVVTIEEQSGENVRFPGAPMITSLENYAAPTPGGWVAAGQPVVCVTTCNPVHPDYERTHLICELESIDDSQTIYEWKVSLSLGMSAQSFEPLQHLRSSAWFAGLNGPVLDSIYFANGSVVQCSARAVSSKGHGGFETVSDLVTAVNLDARCPYSKVSQNAVNVDAYEAATSHTKDGKIKLTVSIPHRVGLIPLISTTPIMDLHMVLFTEGTRVAEHPCSNMLSSNEVRTQDGFLKHRTSHDNLTAHQFDEKLRGNRTVEFYRNLDLRNCRWTFISTFTTTEITNICGGKLLSDRVVPMTTRREVSMQLPLYITYAYFTNSMGQPWKHFDQSTILDIVYSYDSVMTAWSPDNSPAGPILGTIESVKEKKPEEPKFSADIKLLHVKVVDGGTKVHVRFKTRTKFRGKFVTGSPTSSHVARVIRTLLPSTEFELKLLRTLENSPHPQQLWRFNSLRTLKMDYMGLYNITLLPCEFPPTSLTTCDIRAPITLPLNVMELTYK